MMVLPTRACSAIALVILDDKHCASNRLGLKLCQTAPHAPRKTPLLSPSRNLLLSIYVSPLEQTVS
jgi:hypothetical protein